MTLPGRNINFFLILSLNCLYTNGNRVYCSGTSHALSHVWNNHAACAIFRGCTHVKMNVEIVVPRHEWGSEVTEPLDLSCLQDVEEINGGLIIAHSRLERIRLPKLRIINGNQKTIPLTYVEGKVKPALYIHDMESLQYLSLPNLTAIKAGTVSIASSPILRYIPTRINWSSLLGRRETKNDVLIDGVAFHRWEDGSIDKELDQRIETCNQRCGDNCWGPNEEDCQLVTRGDFCEHDHCRWKEGCYHINETGRYPCCHSYCFSGCTGPGPQDCYTCAKISMNGECMTDCGSKHYMPDGFTPNRNVLYEFEGTCVEKCPEPLVHSIDLRCAESCGVNHVETLRSVCVRCREGECQEQCHFKSKHPSEEGVRHPDFDELRQLENCSIIQGSLYLVGRHLLNNYNISAAKALLAEYLSNVQVITGALSITSFQQKDWGDHIWFLPNLMYIHGRQSLHDRNTPTLRISHTDFKFLGFRRLEQISAGKVAITQNPKLCLNRNISWPSITSDKSGPEPIRDKLASNSLCARGQMFFCSATNHTQHDVRKKNSVCQGAEETFVREVKSIGMTVVNGGSYANQCHPSCNQSLGCWGPYADMCISCAQFKLDHNHSCSLTCPEESYYHRGSSCFRCHPVCATCSGSGPADCTSCRYARAASDGRCVVNCSHGFTRNADGNCENLEAARVEQHKKVIIGISVTVALTVAFAAAAAIPITARCRNLRKTDADLFELLDAPNPDARPNMNKLSLIPETDLLMEEKQLGSGAFGTVYKGFLLNYKPQRAVAIKVLNDSSAEAQNNLLEESAHMASLRHRFLIPYLGLCIGKKMMIVTCLMPLGNLLKYVKDHRDNIGSHAFLRWFVQIAEGMSYLEENHVVHRDLAARNILVQSHFHVRVSDFGLSKCLDYDEDEYVALNDRVAFKWLAIECMRQKVFSHKTDVWAYGVTIWELLSYGESPYKGMTVQEIPLFLERGERLLQPKICTLDVYMVLIKCWMVDGDSRPDFARLVEIFKTMCRDPPRYICVPGDKFMRAPSFSADWMRYDNDSFDEDERVDPAEYFRIRSPPNTASTCLPNIAESPELLRLESTSKQRYVKDPCKLSIAADELKTLLDRDNYLVPNSSCAANTTKGIPHSKSESSSLCYTSLAPTDPEVTTLVDLPAIDNERYLSITKSTSFTHFPFDFAVRRRSDV